MAKSKRTVYHEPNHDYFLEHFAEFIEEHGGEWVVIAGGELVGFTRKDLLSKLVKKARKMHPDDIPLVAPIPKEEELQCIL